VLALVIDTSSAAVTAGIVDLGSASAPTGAPTVLAERVTVNARAHGERLAPNVQQALADAGCTTAELTAVIAGLGPGPFTGLRVGLMTAAAFGDALGLPTYGVCSLDGIAAGLDAADLLVTTEARRREVYWARYQHGVRVEGPAVDKPAALVAALTPPHPQVTGAGVALYPEAFAGLVLGDGPDYPTVAGLAAQAQERVLSGAPSEVLSPLYLRRPDAVEPGAGKSVSQR
jgi:tRNA threonylcarbamoyl adenosine modification protein YeaZ